MGFVPLKSYKGTTNGASAITAVALTASALAPASKKLIARCYTTSADDAIIIFGGSGVASSASATYTSGILPDDNILLGKSTVQDFVLNRGQTHFSIIRPAGTDVTVNVVLGYEG